MLGMYVFLQIYINNGVIGASSTIGTISDLALGLRRGKGRVVRVHVK